MGRRVGNRKKVRNERDAFRGRGREREKEEKERERQTDRHTERRRTERIARLRAVHIQCSFLLL